ncbi:hypothetical protein [Colwellia sp. E2M01]|uniref:hypothetical protein n=1 Tax=Colwellia sp. E2M01 TaxID=2841561 RepID=UPI001C08DBA3|nr:hypothetical protein [Colwellia sp. E2M01]MBU2870497.1 hypothetical protein [Colwellia sp. E2M01]
MKIKLHNSHVLIGAKSTTAQAINLPRLPPEETLITVNNADYVSYFCSLPKSRSSDNNAHQGLVTNDKTSRCLQLIEELFVQIEQTGEKVPVDAPVFWLLPEFVESYVDDSNPKDINNQHTFADFAKALQQALPELFSHPQSQLFPFGRSSFPIALTSAKALLEAGQANTITLISVDSLWHEIPQLFADNILVSNISEQGIIPSEGAIITQISQADKGISIDFIQNNVAPSKQRDLSIKQLFSESITALIDSKLSIQEKKQQSSPITLSHLYLPGNGDETLQSSWLEAYFQLAEAVDGNTKICQSGLFTGEIGCVTGLYNFLHIASSYENKFIQGNTLQLEVSNSLYQGAVLYSYDSEGHE